MKNIFKLRRPTKKSLLLLVAVGLLVVFGSLATIELAPAFVATMADNVLRPVIGNKPTIALESAMLSLSDELKRVAYGTVAKPSGNIYNAEPTESSRPVPIVTTQESIAAVDKTALDLSPLSFYQPNFTKLASEGEWSLVAPPQFNGQPLMAKTFVRPDPQRDFAIVALLQMNMHALSLHAVAGTQHPGAVLGHPGPGVIPADVAKGPDLVAAFNGGFQYKDGHYGMVVGQTTYVPMRDGLGTLTMYRDGSLDISRYNSAIKATKPIEAMRQNGPLIVDNGNVTPDAVTGGYAVWGRTTTNSIYTWRSGIGLTSNGNLIYAVGPSLTSKTLAEALKAGGATEAMQLDINAFWVRFVTFTPTAAGSYAYGSILSTLANGGSSYLHGYNKDFFYVTKNPAVVDPLK